MLKRLITAIARLLGLQTQPLDNPAQPTPTAGLAHQEPTQPRGNKRSVAATKRQSKPVAQKPKRKPSAAPSTKAAASRKPKQKPAQPAGKASGASGKQPATRASKTRQHAK